MTIKQFLMTKQMLAGAVGVPLLAPIFGVLFTMLLKGGYGWYLLIPSLLLIGAIGGLRKIINRFDNPILLRPFT